MLDLLIVKKHWMMLYYPFPKRQILDFPKLKEFAVDNFKIYENGKKFSKRVEKAGGKGEISFRAISPVPTVFLKDLESSRWLWKEKLC